LGFNDGLFLIGASQGNQTLESLSLRVQDVTEISPKGRVVYTESLLGRIPKPQNYHIFNESDNLIQQFSQPVALHNGGQFVIVSTLYQKAATLNFGTQQVQISAGGSKQTYEVFNWPFKSQLNMLQIHMNFTTQGKLISACSGTKDATQQTFSHVALTTDKGQININLLSVANLDNKTTFINARANSTNIIIETNSFNHSMIYDPDFSVLLGGGAGGSGGCGGSGDQSLFYASLALIGLSFIIIMVFIVTVKVLDYRKQQAKLAKKKAAESAFLRQQEEERAAAAAASALN